MINKRKEQFLKITRAEKLRLKTCGFIHIPKTGGTSIGKFGSKVIAGGGKFPIAFPHGWTAEQIFNEFPKIELYFIIREPLERTISGINSRIRMGRPQYNIVWNVGEAVSFNFFPTAVELLNGLAAQDERIKSAAIFAFKHINHLKHGYEFYFKDAAFIRANADRFPLVREISDSDSFVTQLCARTGINPQMLDQHYRRLHVAPQSTSNLAASLAPETLAAARKFLSREYEIYDELKKLTGRTTS